MEAPAPLDRRADVPGEPEAGSATPGASATALEPEATAPEGEREHGAGADGEATTPAPDGEATTPAPDGVPLYLRHWVPAGDPWAVILIVHGIGEHSGRYERAARLMAGAGIDVHSFDLRGHGRSEGARVYVQRWDRYLDDLEGVIALIRTSGLPLVLMGHSMGALISLDYALSERPQPDLLVLSAPPLGAVVPAWQRVVAPLLSGMSPGLVMSNPISGDQLSHDPEVGKAYFKDPLVQPRATARLAAELFGAMKRIRGSIGALKLPTLVIHGAEDRLVPSRFSEPLGSLPGVERLVLPGLRHETLNEPEGPQVVAYIVGWIEDRVPARAGWAASSEPPTASRFHHAQRSSVGPRR